METIYSYSTQDAINDGDMINIDDQGLEALRKEHYKFPVVFSRAVWMTVQEAVNDGKSCNDLEGVVHDILHMSKVAARNAADGESLVQLQVYITQNQKNHLYDMFASVGPMSASDPRPVITIFFCEEY